MPREKYPSTDLRRNVSPLLSFSAWLRRPCGRLAQLAIVAVFLLTLSGTTERANAQSFAPNVSYATGNTPQQSVARDFNGDNKNDLIVTNFYSNNISVFLNQGNGTFQPAVYYASDVHPGPVVAEDFNGDGKMDVVVGNHHGGLYSIGSVSFFSGNGDGTFQPALHYAYFLDGGNSLTTGDFNKDGRVDIAGTSYSPADNGYRLSLLFNNGNGAFQAAVFLPVVANRGVKAVDLNADGNLDLVALDFDGSKCRVVLGNGNGTFQPVANYNVMATRVTTGDLNGDTKQDVVLATGHDIAVLLGKGDGTMLPPVIYRDNNISNPELADFNGDGKLDIATAGFYTSSLTILRGKGDGTFHFPINFPVGLNPSFLSASDFNADGKPDVAVISNANSVVRVLNSPSNAPLLHTAPFRATATEAANDILVATFTDSDASRTASSFAAKIIWGDGTAYTFGTVSANDSGGFNVTGTHTYAKEGTYDVIVQIIDTNNNIASEISVATVADAPITSTGKTIYPTYQAPFSGVVATFRDADPRGKASEFTATINWGDGTVSTGVIIANTSWFDINGTHTYNSSGTFSISVLVTASAGSNTVANSTANVAKADQAISFAALPNKTYGDAPFTLSASASSGLPVAFSILSGPASLSGNTVTITGTGTVVVRASQQGDSNYNPASNVDRSFTVKAVPVITWNNPADISYGTPLSATQLNASANVPGTFTYTPSAGTVLNSGEGQILSVNFIPADTANYNSASKTVQLNVSKAQATLTLGALTQTYTGTPRSVTVTTTPANLSGVSLSYAQNGVPVASPTVAGSYDVVASLINANHQASNVTGTLVISKANQTITFNPIPGKSFGNAPFVLSASASSGLPVSFQIISGPATLSGNTLTITGAGIITVRALQSGNTNYNAAPGVEQTFNVSRASSTINLSALVHIYDGTPKSPVATTNPAGLKVTFSYSQNGTSSSSPINAGAYNVMATIDEINYQGSATSVLIINKANPVIAWNNPQKIDFGVALGSAQLNATANVPGTFQYSPPAGTTLAVGTHQLTVTFTPADTVNYNSGTQSVQLVVGIPPLQLILDEAEGDSQQAAAMDALLFLRGPFPVINVGNLLLQLQDPNTRVLLFVNNLRLAQGENASSVIVNLVDGNNQIYEVAAEDVRVVPGFSFTQVIFRLPDTLAPGTCTIKVKAQGQESNAGTIKIRS